MKARIVSRPATFDRVDLVKRAVGEEPLPGDSDLWILGGPLVFEIDGFTRTVVEGFTTDGASVPRWARWLTGWQRWDEPQRWAAIVHDWLYCQGGMNYRNPGVSKVFADRAFHALLEAEGANWWMRTIMYYAVRIGGGRAYWIDQQIGPKVYDRNATGPGGGRLI